MKFLQGRMPYLLLLAGLLFLQDAVFAQTFNDGPLRLRVRVRDIQVNFGSNHDIAVLGAPDEYRFKLWIRDAANQDGNGWVNNGNNIFKQDGDPPLTTNDFNAILFDHNYTGATVPQFFDIRMEAWEDVCDADPVTGPGDDNQFDTGDCCAGAQVFGTCAGVSVDDGRHCDADPFETSIDYRAGPPCEWFDHGYIIGNCPNNNQYRPRIESFWRYTNGETFGDPIDLGTLTPGGSFTHFNSTKCYSDNFSGSLSSPGNDVYYKFTTNQTLGVRASLCGGATWNTNMYILDGSGNEIFANNNGSSCAPQSEIARNLCNPGTYYVVVDGNTASDQGEFTLDISEDPNLEFTTSLTENDVSCNGGSDGLAAVSISGGSPPYTIQWSPVSSSNDTISNLSAGNYIVNVTDQQNCTISDTATIDEPAPLSVSATGTNPTCNGGSDGTITITSSSGGTTPYEYSIGGAFQPSVNFNNVPADTHTVTIKDDNTCTGTTTVVTTDPPAINLNLTSTDINCFGANDGTISANPSGGTPPYQCALDGSGVFIACDTFKNLSPGLHTVTVQDADGCTNSAGLNVNAPPELKVSKLSTLDVSCGGGSDGGLTVQATGGIPPYEFSIDNGNTFQSDSSFTGLSASNYTIIARDSNNCTSTVSITVNEPAPLNLSLLFKTPVSCNGLSDGEVVTLASGGTGPYTYSLDGGPQQPSGAFNNLSAGTYQTVVTDNNGCTDTLSVVVNEPAPISVNAASITNASCVGIDDGSITLNGSGGTTPYEFSLNGGPFQSNQTFSGLAPDTYGVGIRDINGCKTTDSVTVGTNISVTASVSNKINVNCHGDSSGSLTITANGGTTPYIYRLNGGTGQSSNIFSNLPAGNYTGQVEDDNGCKTFFTTTINEPPQLKAQTDSVTDASCFNTNDGAIDMSISGGTPPYSFNWSNNAQTEDISNVAGGTYTLTVTDDNGCTKQTSVTVDQPPALFTNIITKSNASCNGASDGEIILDVNGGTPPFSFNWSNGDTSQGITGLAAGTYDLTITEGNGCTVQESFSITEPQPITLSTTKTDVSCKGGSNGSITLTVNGGQPPFDYFWSNFGFTKDLNNIPAGTYTVIVTDDNGCEVTTSVTINEPPQGLTVDLDVTEITCAGQADGELVANVSGGGSNLSYNWSTGDTTKSIANLAGGTYEVTVTDNSGCQGTDAASLQEPTSINIDLSVIDNDCNGSSNGLAVPFVTGGSPPYNYNWGTQPPQTNPVAESLPAGSFPLVVTDNRGCQDTATAVVEQPTSIDVSLSPIDVSCTSGDDGEVVVSASGGEPPYLYSAKPNVVQSDSVITGLSPGEQGVRVRDQNGCEAFETFTLIDPDTFSVTLPKERFVSLGGSITLEPSISTTNTITDFIWKPAKGLSCTDCENPVASPAETTTYTLATINQDSCSATAQVKVTVKSDVEVLIPNAFSPNQDDVNDELEIFDFGALQEMEFQIFNRWGELIFETENPNMSWDGTRSGEELPAGIYIYQLTGTMLDGNEIEKQGSVTLIR